MEDNKVRPWDDYDYTAKLPDFWEFSGLVLGLGLCKGYQSSLVRPLNRTASIALMSGYMLGGYLIGKAATIYRNESNRRRLLFIDDYVDKHPEDFMSLEPKKYKDVLWEWNPHR